MYILRETRAFIFVIKFSILIHDFLIKCLNFLDLDTRSPERLQKHRVLSADFASLYKELLAEGLFEPCLSHVAVRYLEIATIGILGLRLFAQGWSFVGMTLICWAAGRAPWFVHEAGHISLTGKPGFDRWFQSHIYGWVITHSLSKNVSRFWLICK